MKSSDWQIIEAAFERAVALEGDDLQGYLAEFGQEHPDLLRQLDKLLAADDGSDRELRAPIESTIEAFGLDSEDPWLGRQLGPWTVTERLAGGGMGAVFLARRSDENYSQSVAIKVMATQLLATDAIERFRAERQILANLNHPYIAKLLDGGSTEDGLPYLVMEYVDGLPVDHFCNVHKLDIDARLRLFRKICAAVDFAHRNLVVHRDLKPGNILVDNDGNPKLLDFGIAKLLDTGSYNDAFARTREGLRVLTPEYASPEQVRGESISVATDVYSLGVLLYRLITGQSPYGNTVSSSRDYERAIVEEEPHRPSTAITSPDTAPELLEERQTSKRLLKKRLVGDLDNIVLKALQKDPERRYPTASALSADIERLLDLRPVEARGDEWSYLAGKFVRRHRRGVLLVAASIAVLGGFVAYHFQRLAAERDMTAQEAAKAENVAAFLLSLFETADPDRSRGETITARALLDQGARRVDRELAEQPAVRAAMQDAMGGAYQGLGLYPESMALLDEALVTRRELYGPQHPDVLKTMSRVASLADDRGDYDAAEHQYLQALETSRALNGENHAVTAALLAGLGNTLHEQGRHAEAQKRYEAALSIFEAVAPDGSADFATALHGYGWLLTDTAKFADAESQLTRAIEMLKATVGEKHPEVSAAMNHLTYLYMHTGRWDDANRAGREALALSTAIFGVEHPHVNSDRQTLATILQQGGHYADAERLFRLALASDTRLLGEAHPYVAVASNNLAGVLQVQGKFDEAEALYRESLAVNRAVHGRDHPETATSIANLGVLLTGIGRFDEAEQFYDEALDIRRTQLGGDHPATTSSLHIYANQLALLEDYERAVPLYEEILEIRRRVLGNEHPNVATVLANYAIVLRDLGQLEEAQAAAAEALAILEASDGAGDATAAKAVHIMAGIAQDAGRPEAALDLYENALARYASLPTPRDLRRAGVLTSFGRFLTENGRAGDALPLLEEAVSIREESLPAGHWVVGISRSELGACQAVLGMAAASDNLALGQKILVDSLGPQNSLSRRAIAQANELGNQPAN